MKITFPSRPSQARRFLPAVFRRNIVIAGSLALFIGSALAWGHIPSSTPSPNHAAPQPAFDYSAATGLGLFRQICTTTAIPTSSSSAYQLSDGNLAHLSLDRSLQTGVRAFLERKKVPYAVFVAIEPKTGRVLANVSYSAQDHGWEPRAAFTAYPMASLFKLITAAAAFESGAATAQTSLHFRGAPCSESPGLWGKPGRSRDASMPLSNAMAHSVNPAFGRLAGDKLGKPLLVNTAQRFGLGCDIYGSREIASGTLTSPDTIGELMRMAAGLDHGVRTSPFHAAMLLAAIANGGVMPVPSFVDAVADPAGTHLYSFRAAPLATVTSPAAAGELIRSMSETVITGTARRAFNDRSGHRFGSELKVAGKTGSICGTAPKGYYNWFAGLAPADNPKIAFAALVINNGRIRLRAPALGRAALDIFFSENLLQLAGTQQK
ncbi:penicillin-binding transpeptidase domain-containing protein [Geobacter sp. SVR]|uniref:penicillin-binding transpeptidase domain-containing protein n=1 Tax=Geobacter sp. SVR TaxID=2495594 RepID=UPI00143F0195|nr:penicillin-binding transpeptidase domain-containing protein [Geobacter sp. SVR]BCS54024.1 penicillin-binding protein [Geobacter sp. SVR]GCF86195.1 hypothetical protein GSbR_27950 [Geobacter sp. SVR]